MAKSRELIPQNQILPDTARQDLLRPYTSVNRYITAGMLVILLGFGGFGAWSAVAPLKSGAIAPGVISVESNRKTIQHLEGGIIDEIHVEEGGLVAADQLLITLDDTKPNAEVELLRGQFMVTLANESQLLAKRDGAEAITFPEELMALQDDPRLAEILRTHQNAFDAERLAIEGKKDIFGEQIAQANEEIEVLKAQIKSFKEQLRLISLEVRDVKTLVDKGLARRPRLLALQRTAAQLNGEIQSNAALITRAKQRISETELKIIDLENSAREQAVSQLRDVQRLLSDLRERLRAAEAVLARTKIRAPQEGYIVNLQFFTRGGVVRPGEPILDLVPKGDTLIVETELDPQYIDTVYPGLPAIVTLSAFNRRTTPSLTGEVIHVSADRFEDQRTGRPYYMARVRIDAEELAALEDLTLAPGMPAEVMIVTGERTALDYLIQPVRDSMRRAFTEE